RTSATTGTSARRGKRRRSCVDATRGTQRGTLRRRASVPLVAVLTQQPLPEIRSAGDVAFSRLELLVPELLQMRRLSLDEQLVDGGDLEAVDQAQIDSHADAGEQVHRLFGGDRLRAAEDPVGPRDLIVQPLAVLAD